MDDDELEKILERSRKGMQLLAELTNEGRQLRAAMKKSRDRLQETDAQFQEFYGHAKDFDPRHN